jgi:hypothetical protein
MPSRKVRRRREKLKRHEYEYVLETDEGEEVLVERPTPDPKKDGAKASAPSPRERGGREIPKPTLARVLRRTAIFAPLILVVVFLTSSKDATTAAKIYTAGMLLAFFIPFSYLVDVVMYRALTRRRQRAQAKRS